MLDLTKNVLVNGRELEVSDHRAVKDSTPGIWERWTWTGVDSRQLGESSGAQKPKASLVVVGLLGLDTILNYVSIIR